MIRVTLEICPGGDESKAEIIERGYIYNTGRMEGQRHRYVVRLNKAPRFGGGLGFTSPSWRTGEALHLRSRSAWELLRSSLNAAIGGPAPPPVDSLDDLIGRIAAWQAVTFPTVTGQAAAEHLRREAVELAAAPADAMEMADVFHLLVAVAHHAGVDLAQAVAEKFGENLRRRWGRPDAAGVVEHER